MCFVRHIIRPEMNLFFDQKPGTSTATSEYNQLSELQSRNIHTEDHKQLSSHLSMEVLPAEMWLRIVSFFDLATLNNFSQTCKYIHALAQNLIDTHEKRLWYLRIVTMYPLLPVTYAKCPCKVYFDLKTKAVVRPTKCEFCADTA